MALEYESGVICFLGKVWNGTPSATLVFLVLKEILSVQKFSSEFLNIDKLYAAYLFPSFLSLLPLLTVDEFVLMFCRHSK